MEVVSFTKFIIALLFVLGLLYLCLFILKKFGVGQVPGSLTQGGNKQKALKVLEFLSLDSKRRVVRLRYRDEEHVILTGPHGDQLLSKRTIAEQTDQTDKKEEHSAA